MAINTKTKGLGFWMLTALVVGNMIGSGIYLLPSSLASYGSISLLSWILTTVGSLLLALLFVNLNKALPRTGGPYLYCHEAFGDFIGFLIAYTYWIAIWVANAAVAVALVGYLSIFIPTMSEQSPNYQPWLALFAKVGSVWFFTIINIIGVRSAGITQIITTILKILPLIILTVVGLFFIDPHYLKAFNTSGQSNLAALGGAGTLTFWAFIGLESATIPAEDANNPKDIARATIFGTLVAAVIYIASTVVIMGLIPSQLLQISEAPYAEVAKLLFGHKFVILITLSAIISCAGALNGWILLQGQVPYAAARDGLFPQFFAKLGRFHTPVIGQIVSSGLVTLLLLLTINSTLVKQFTFIVLLATLSYLVPYFACALAELRLLQIKPQLFHGKRLGKYLLGVLAGIYSLWMIVGSGWEVIQYGLILFLTGLPLYAILKWQQRTGK